MNSYRPTDLDNSSACPTPSRMKPCERSSNWLCSMPPLLNGFAEGEEVDRSRNQRNYKVRLDFRSCPAVDAGSRWELRLLVRGVPGRGVLRLRALRERAL